MLYETAGMIALRNWASSLVGCFQFYADPRLRSSRVPIVIPIQVLFALCCPSTVVRFVISVIVDTVNRGANRLSAHIRQEVFERLSPTYTNRNTAPAIALPVFMLSICASLNHRRPSSVFWRGVTRERMAVLQSSPTAAAARVPALQIISLSNRFVAAIAKTIPASLFTALARWRDDHKQAETLTCEIESRWHMSDYTTTKHMWKRTA